MLHADDFTETKDAQQALLGHHRIRWSCRETQRGGTRMWLRRAVEPCSRMRTVTTPLMRTSGQAKRLLPPATCQHLNWCHIAGPRRKNLHILLCEVGICAHARNRRSPSLPAPTSGPQTHKDPLQSGEAARIRPRTLLDSLPRCQTCSVTALCSLVVVVGWYTMPLLSARAMTWTEQFFACQGCSYRSANMAAPRRAVKPKQPRCRQPHFW